MNRYVEDLPVYVVDGPDLHKIGQGITHYRVPWSDHINGEGLRHELIAAGIHDAVQVTYHPDSDELDISVPFDDTGKLQSKIAKTIEKHKGVEAKDHKALLEFSGSVRAAAELMAAGGEVSQAERDIVLGVLAGRLV